MPRQRAAFTLLEVLVVLVLIAVLAALLLGTIHQVREGAHQTRCLSNLRQIALATFAYTTDHDGFLPAQHGDGLPVRAAGGDGENYYDLLTPYLQSPEVWRCPTTHLNAAGHVGHMSYHMNGLLITVEGLRLAAISEPAAILLVSEAGETRRWDEAFLRPDQDANYGYDLPISNHRGGGNVAMADGHVQWYHDTQRNAESFKLAP